MLAFQSFQGRSCVTLVVGDLRTGFEAANPGYVLRIEKLTGFDSPTSLYASSPVKKLTLVQHRVSADKFTTYGMSGSPGGYDFEVGFKARRGGHLGALSEVTGGLSRTDKGLVIFRGEEFEEAVATVLIGKRQRPVGIIGPKADTGAIDVSQDVTRAANGHPTFESISQQATDIAMDLYRRITGK
jgi:hypothetical protein